MLFRPLKTNRPPYSKRKQSAARRVKPKNIPLAGIAIGNPQERPFAKQSIYKMSEIHEKIFQLPT